MSQLKKNQYRDANGFIKNRLDWEAYNKFLLEQQRMIKAYYAGELDSRAPVDLGYWKTQFKKYVGVDLEDRTLIEAASSKFCAQDNYGNWFLNSNDAADSLCASLLMVTEWIKRRMVMPTQIVLTSITDGHKYIDEKIYAGEPWRKRVFNEDVRVVILHGVSDKVLESVNAVNHRKLMNELSTFVGGRNDRCIIVSASCKVPGEMNEGERKQFLSIKSKDIYGKVSALFDDKKNVILAPRLTAKPLAQQTPLHTRGNQIHNRSRAI